MWSSVSHEQRVHAEQVQRRADRGVRLAADRARAGGEGRRPGGCDVRRPGRPRAPRGCRASPPRRTCRPSPRASLRARRGSARSWFSATTAPADSMKLVPLSDEHETTMSKSRDAFVGAFGMNARNRGLSIEMIAVARCVAKISSTFSGSLPCSLRRPSIDAAGSAPMPAVVERDRVERQPVPAVLEDGLAHLRVVREHRVPHAPPRRAVGARHVVVGTLASWISPPSPSTAGSRSVRRPS